MVVSQKAPLKLRLCCGLRYTPYFRGFKEPERCNIAQKLHRIQQDLDGLEGNEVRNLVSF